MIKEFENIIITFNQTAHNIEVDHKNSPLEWEQQSCHLNLTTTNFLGAMTVWSSGECEMEILSSTTGDRVLWDYSILRSLSELSTIFNQFSQVFIDDSEK